MYSVQNTKAEVAIVAINEMMKKSFFSICAVDRAADVLGVRPRKESYDMLHALHCVNFSSMPRSLQEKIPYLIADCLGDPPAFQFGRTEPLPVVNIVAETVSNKAEESKPGLFKRLQIAFKG